MSADTLTVWNLANPCQPILVGTVSLVAQNRGLMFSYAPDWIANGYPLSGDMPLQRAAIIPLSQNDGLGAINDAMPDRWGERAIRYLDRPQRITSLDLLYLAGDRRFGALGFSSSRDSYQPHIRGALPEIGSLELLNDLISRIESNDPLSEHEKLVISSTKTMGGAHPKALVQLNGVEYIAKFPRGSNVDTSLIEHASLVLAGGCGITVSETIAMPTLTGHVVLVKRFDREHEKRLHCLSAKTALLCGVSPGDFPIGELSYPAMADFIRQYSHPDKQIEDRKELFRRMAFNILIENTDDHEKNHAFIFSGGYWSLAPAFDVLPLMSNSGHQEMIVGEQGMESSMANALSQCEHFGFDKEGAIGEWFSVADRIAQWKTIFSEVGVTKMDIKYLADFIDSDDRILMRDKNAFSGMALQPGNR